MREERTHRKISSTQKQRQHTDITTTAGQTREERHHGADTDKNTARHTFTG